MLHKDWFGIDIGKRAARVRSRPFGSIIMEALSNSLDADATTISITCGPKDGTRRDGDGLKAFEVTCTDNGTGCDDPEILRRVGSTTNDLHAGTRGRFGQGLIDLIAISEATEIRTHGHRLVFNKDGCKITTITNKVEGLSLNATLRHGGEGFGDLDDLFDRVILPEGVTLTLNGRPTASRVRAERLIPRIRLSTVIYDPGMDVVRKTTRHTTVELHTSHGDVPMIHELGIPVDTVPWELPYDINVMQKTPLDSDRNMLADKYKARLVSLLIPHAADEYIEFMDDHEELPSEIRNDEKNAESLGKASEPAKRKVVEKATGANYDDLVRRDPFNKDDKTESSELEAAKGKAPVNRRYFPPGVRALMGDLATVAKEHDRICKPHFTASSNFPPQTERQRECIAAYKVIAEALLEQTVCFDRIRGGECAAAWSDGTIKLNIDVDYLWDDPLSEESIGTILHECAHKFASGHGYDFASAVQRLGGKLAGWVGRNQQQWDELRDMLYGQQCAGTLAHAVTEE